jgi:DNA-binding transcriptional ArsR family regulator
MASGGVRSTMSTDAGLLPRRPPIDEPDRGTHVTTLGTGEAADACKLLGTETAAAILSQLASEPGTASDVAGDVDTSLQNVDYHLKRLHDAGLVRAVGTWFSERGTEMTVYAPAHERLVIEIDAPLEGPRPDDGEPVARQGCVDGD